MLLTAEESQALWLSARVAACATLLCLPAGIALAWVLARRRFPGKFIVDVLVQLPMVLPPVVPGYALLLLFGNRGLIGSFLLQHFGVTFAFNWKGAVLASAVMAFPLMVQPMRIAFRLIDEGLEQAATTLGASPWVAFMTVSLPLAVPGIIAGAVLCFSRGLGEFGATMAFVGNVAGQTRTLPLALYTLMHVPDGEHAAARLSMLSVGLAVVALLLAHLMNRRAERLLGRSL